jgi:phage recombination protein Bet
MGELIFAEEEERFIKNRFRLTDDQLEVFLCASKRYGLNPIANQIYPQLRGNNMTITTGIDGYRLIADRTGKYAGNDDPVFDDEAQPRKATVTVYKIVGGQRCGFTATARWDQYFPGEKQGFMWKKMPHLMLGKCAEALAIRKAFPAELSGLYTQEEMQQASAPDNGHTEVEPPRPQREVPEAAPETEESKNWKAHLIEVVREWTGQDDVLGMCKQVLEFHGFPTDGTATNEMAKIAATRCKQFSSESKTFEEAILQPKDEEVSQDNHTEEEAPW